MNTRQNGTNRDGHQFTQADIWAVWQKARTIQGYDPTVWRADVCGSPIKYGDYGNINSQHGWEVDHIIPVSAGGSDDLSNLQALQWQRNRMKGDTRQSPVLYCLLQAA